MQCNISPNFLRTFFFPDLSLFYHFLRNSLCFLRIDCKADQRSVQKQRVSGKVFKVRGSYGEQGIDLSSKFYHCFLPSHQGLISLDEFRKALNGDFCLHTMKKITHPFEQALVLLHNLY